MLDYLNVTSITSSNFNVSNPTKIIIHGFGSSCTKIWPREMRLSFLQVEDVNVICVDWAAGAVDPNYVRAAVNTRLVGKQVGADSHWSGDLQILSSDWLTNTLPEYYLD